MATAHVAFNDKEWFQNIISLHMEPNATAKLMQSELLLNFISQGTHLFLVTDENVIFITLQFKFRVGNI